MGLWCTELSQPGSQSGRVNWEQQSSTSHKSAPFNQASLNFAYDISKSDSLDEWVDTWMTELACRWTMEED